MTRVPLMIVAASRMLDLQYVQPSGFGIALGIRISEFFSTPQTAYRFDKAIPISNAVSSPNDEKYQKLRRDLV
jgi:hypothetical protein